MSPEAKIKLKLAVVVLVAALLIFILVAPLLTLRVKVALPPLAEGNISPRQVIPTARMAGDIVAGAIFVFDALLVGLVVLISSKVAKRILSARRS